MSLPKKILLSLLVITLILMVSIPLTRSMLVVYYNENFVRHIYHLPTKKGKFVVAIEAREGANYKIPVFVKPLLSQAFNDYEVVYDSQASKPDLIIRDRWLTRKEVGMRANVIVPYMTISGEPDSLSISKYKPYGVPFAELVSATPQKERELYFPFIGWSAVKIIE